MLIRLNQTPIRLRLLVVSLAMAASLMSARADRGSTAFIPANIRSKDVSAVDAKGVRHEGKDYGDRPPWIRDITKMVAPEYPFQDRARRHEGAGLFQSTLDLKTGAVTKVIVLRSTGFPQLDRCAVLAYRQWRLKPGKWKEITMPTRFRMATSAREPLPQGAMPIPNR